MVLSTGSWDTPGILTSQPTASEGANVPPFVAKEANLGLGKLGNLGKPELETMEKPFQMAGSQSWWTWVGNWEPSKSHHFPTKSGWPDGFWGCFHPFFCGGTSFLWSNLLHLWCLEAEGCGGLHAEYELAWKAEGETFFDDPWAAESQMSEKQRLILWVL